MKRRANLDHLGVKRGDDVDLRPLARCDCPRDGLPPLNPCPKHHAHTYARFAARHKASA